MGCVGSTRPQAGKKRKEIRRTNLEHDRTSLDQNDLLATGLLGPNPKLDLLRNLSHHLYSSIPDHQLLSSRVDIFPTRRTSGPRPFGRVRTVERRGHFRQSIKAQSQPQSASEDLLRLTSAAASSSPRRILETPANMSPRRS